MTVTILNADPNENQSPLDRYLYEAKKKLSTDHEVEILNLRDMKLTYCTGCLNCWLKNPGKCSAGDDSDAICEKYIRSDFVIFASPLILGFPSELLKRAQDKLIPVLLPYIDIMGGECHHQMRYKHYPKLGLIWQKEEDTDAEDLRILRNIYDRFALNFHGRVLFDFDTDSPLEEVENAIHTS